MSTFKNPEGNPNAFKLLQAKFRGNRCRKIHIDMNFTTSITTKFGL